MTVVLDTSKLLGFRITGIGAKSGLKTTGPKMGNKVGTKITGPKMGTKSSGPVTSAKG